MMFSWSGWESLSLRLRAISTPEIHERYVSAVQGIRAWDRNSTVELIQPLYYDFQCGLSSIRRVFFFLVYNGYARKSGKTYKVIGLFMSTLLK